MRQDQVNDAEGIESSHSLGTWTRIYLHGFIALVAFAVLATLVSRLVPLFDFTGNRTTAIVVSLIAILAGPPVIGSVILYIIFPLIGKRDAWRGLLFWDDRLLKELSRARGTAQIVLIDWPSKEVRSMGVMTSTFRSRETGEELAAVYVPTAPQTRLGYIRVVPVDSVEMTDWTLKQWQTYQLTFGASCPDQQE